MEKLEQTKKNFEEGIKFFQKKDFKKAQFYFEKTLEVAPNSSPTLENLSKSYLETGDYDKAEKILKYFISLNKENDQIAYKLLYDIYSTLNKYDELKNLTKTAINKNKFDNEFQLKSSLFYPSFFNSLEEIDEIRKKFTDEVEKLIQNEKVPNLDLSEKLFQPPNFKLSYDGYDNLEINKKLIKLYKKIYPGLESIGEYSFSKNEKIKIGFISEFFSDHTIAKLFKGIIYKLNKENFEVYVFHSNKTLPGKIFNEINESVVSYNYENIILPKDFHEKVKTIRNKNLDLLLYPDIHMSTNLYYLTLLRLAKFQITSWGHPETTGNNKIDFFLSSKLLETDGYQNNFSEKVLLSNYLPMYFYKPKITFALKKEDMLSRNIYFCPQSLFKMHPSFDEAIKKILHKDKKAQIFFIKDRKEILSKMFFKRLNKIMSENVDRINFIDRLTPEEFVHYCGKVSVLLDPFWFGAGNTFHESMLYGTPTVTMPTKYLKSRVVAGAYKQMQIDDAPIFNNIDDYVDKCVELANQDNLDLKMYYKEQAEKNLFENSNVIDDLEKIFKSIVN
jgi:predicted O-linked N-acetylglucosamine transferase (SPINDLY family)